MGSHRFGCGCGDPACPTCAPSGVSADPLCECYGQPGGQCPSCGREHAPAVNGRCEVCTELEGDERGAPMSIVDEVLADLALAIRQAEEGRPSRACAGCGIVNEETSRFDDPLDVDVAPWRGNCMESFERGFLYARLSDRPDLLRMALDELRSGPPPQVPHDAYGPTSENFDDYFEGEREPDLII